MTLYSNLADDYGRESCWFGERFHLREIIFQRRLSSREDVFFRGDVLPEEMFYQRRYATRGDMLPVQNSSLESVREPA